MVNYLSIYKLLTSQIIHTDSASGVLPVILSSLRTPGYLFLAVSHNFFFPLPETSGKLKSGTSLCFLNQLLMNSTCLFTFISSFLSGRQFFGEIKGHCSSKFINNGAAQDTIITIFLMLRASPVRSPEGPLGRLQPVSVAGECCLLWVSWCMTLAWPMMSPGSRLDRSRWTWMLIDGQGSICEQSSGTRQWLKIVGIMGRESNHGRRDHHVSTVKDDLFQLLPFPPLFFSKQSTIHSQTDDSALHYSSSINRRASQQQSQNLTLLNAGTLKLLSFLNGQEVVGVHQYLKLNFCNHQLNTAFHTSILYSSITVRHNVDLFSIFLRWLHVWTC